MPDPACLQVKVTAWLCRLSWVHVQQLEAVGKCGIALASSMVTKMKVRGRQYQFAVNQVSLDEKRAQTHSHIRSLVAVLHHHQCLQCTNDVSEVGKFLMCTFNPVPSQAHCADAPYDTVKGPVTTWAFALAYAPMEDFMPLAQEQLAASRLPYPDRDDVLQVRQTKLL